MGDLSAARLREELHYDPLSGTFEWAKSARGRRPLSGRPPQSQGYLYISIDRERYSAHRLAWLWMTSEWPADQVDHINRIRNDNRWANLRQATHTQNCLNHNLKANNTSGTNGVWWQKDRKRWAVRLRHKHRGYFPTKDDAVHFAELEMLPWGI